MSFQSIIFTALVVTLTLPNVHLQLLQQLTFSGTPDKLHGDFLGFRNKIPDLTPYTSPILQNVVETCGYGWWVAYTQKDYLGEAPYVFLTLDDPVQEPSCNDRLIGDWTANYSSLRYLGASEFQNPSFSIYELTEFRGQEYIIEGNTQANSLPFPIQSFMTTGHSEWSLFPEENFEGDSICYHSFWMMGGVLAIDNFYNGTVGSVKLGCKSSSTTSSY